MKRPLHQQHARSSLLLAVASSSLALLLVAGCAHAPAAVEGPLLELAHDRGTPSERPLISGKLFETLLRFDPKLPAFRPHQIRLLLAQPGAVRLAFYGVDAGDAGKPGKELKVIDRRYGAELVSPNTGERWVVEPLDDLELPQGPFFVGISSDVQGSDARLWASSNGSGAAFSREADGTISPIPRTPVLRVVLLPVAIGP